ncbi:MAG: hypothetical protein IJS56_06725 [Bacilli bacterium]|nr:hypothetical protein [Bacilli bacterium]
MTYEKKISFIINIIIFLLLIIGLVLETFELVMRGEGLYLLVRRFKFFTELSNIFAGITSFVYAYYLFNSKKNPIPNVLKILKLISTGSVMVTFLTVIFYLIPISGSSWKFLVVGSQFIFHIIIPILCFITYTFYEDNKVDNKYILYNLIPITAYGLFYLISGLTHMVDGKIDYEYDWYLFMRNGVVVGLITYAFFIIFNIVIVYLLNKLNGKLNSK